jgi:hypothetical protein
MLCCIVLGMGVPTTANYCIMASTCAPILITLGIPKVAAHFFVFYFGIVADITPPVALAAYAGSAIAKSDPMKTGVNATKLAIAAFVVPYIFAMNPSMLLMNEGFLAAVEVIITSLFGIFAMAAALNGHVYRNMSWFERLIFAAGGITLLIPTFSTDVIGLVHGGRHDGAGEGAEQARQGRASRPPAGDLNDKQKTAEGILIPSAVFYQPSGGPRRDSTSVKYSGMAVSSCTLSPVRGWTNLSSLAWRHWPASPLSGDGAP